MHYYSHWERVGHLCALLLALPVVRGKDRSSLCITTRIACRPGKGWVIFVHHSSHCLSSGERVGRLCALLLALPVVRKKGWVIFVHYYSHGLSSGERVGHICALLLALPVVWGKGGSSLCITTRTACRPGKGWVVFVHYYSHCLSSGERVGRLCALLLALPVVRGKGGSSLYITTRTACRPGKGWVVFVHYYSHCLSSGERVGHLCALLLALPVVRGKGGSSLYITTRIACRPGKGWVVFVHYYSHCLSSGERVGRLCTLLLALPVVRGKGGSSLCITTRTACRPGKGWVIFVHYYSHCLSSGKGWVIFVHYYSHCLSSGERVGHLRALLLALPVVQGKGGSSSCITTRIACRPGKGWVIFVHYYSHCLSSRERLGHLCALLLALPVVQGKGGSSSCITTRIACRPGKGWVIFVHYYSHCLSSRERVGHLRALLLALPVVRGKGGSSLCITTRTACRPGKGWVIFVHYYSHCLSSRERVGLLRALLLALPVVRGKGGSSSCITTRTACRPGKGWVIFVHYYSHCLSSGERVGHLRALLLALPVVRGKGGSSSCITPRIACRPGKGWVIFVHYYSHCLSSGERVGLLRALLLALPVVQGKGGSSSCITTRTACRPGKGWVIFVHYYSHCLSSGERVGHLCALLLALPVVRGKGGASSCITPRIACRPGKGWVIFVHYYSHCLSSGERVGHLRALLLALPVVRGKGGSSLCITTRIACRPGKGWVFFVHYYSHCLSSGERVGHLCALLLALPVVQGKGGSSSCITTRIACRPGKGWVIFVHYYSHCLSSGERVGLLRALLLALPVVQGKGGSSSCITTRIACRPGKGWVFFVHYSSLCLSSRERVGHLRALLLALPVVQGKGGSSSCITTRIACRPGKGWVIFVHYYSHCLSSEERVGLLRALLLALPVVQGKGGSSLCITTRIACRPGKGWVIFVHYYSHCLSSRERVGHLRALLLALPVVRGKGGSSLCITTRTACRPGKGWVVFGHYYSHCLSSGERVGHLCALLLAWPVVRGKGGSSLCITTRIACRPGKGWVIFVHYYSHCLSSRERVGHLCASLLALPVVLGKGVS